MAKPKAAQLLASPANRLHRDQARADEVPHRLMSRIRYPDRRELARTVQLRQADRIAPIRLDPLA